MKKKENASPEVFDKQLSPKELELLECLWSVKKGKSAPKITKMLCEKTGQDYAESTVRTFLTRIEKKGYITKEKDGQNYYYSPTVSERDYRMYFHKKYIEENVREEAFDLILELLRHNKFSKKEVKTMKKLLNDFDKKFSEKK